MVGLDILKENLFFCKKYGAYDDLVLADGCHQPFKEGAFNVSLASEIIEHLHKREGLLLLKELERVTNVKVVVTTPNLWMQQHPLYENGKAVAYSRHLSKWTPSEFRAMKYYVHGIGFKLTLPELGQLQAGLDFILFPGWFIPECSKFMVAYKDVYRPADVDRRAT